MQRDLFTGNAKRETSHYGECRRSGYFSQSEVTEWESVAPADDTGDSSGSGDSGRTQGCNGSVGYLATPGRGNGYGKLFPTQCFAA